MDTDLSKMSSNACTDNTNLQPQSPSNFDYAELCEAEQDKFWLYTKAKKQRHLRYNFLVSLTFNFSVY